jgi:hypothetical protein
MREERTEHRPPTTPRRLACIVLGVKEASPGFAHVIIGGEAREQNSRIGKTIGRSRRRLLHLPDFHRQNHALACDC